MDEQKKDEEEIPVCTVCGRELHKTFVTGLWQWICPIHSTRGVPR